MIQGITSSYRRSLRLPDYDYASAGAYFVTICTLNRICLFGDVNDGAMRMNRFGEIVETCWRDLPNHYPHAKLDSFIIMPNHVHGIIVLKPSADLSKKRNALSEIVRAFKGFSTRRINTLRNGSDRPLWQRGYYEHVVRNEISLAKIREYIVGNPAQWLTDDNHPAFPNADERAGLRPAPTTGTGNFYERAGCARQAWKGRDA
jgi:REP element-mobilizing transposase RayT